MNNLPNMTMPKRQAMPGTSFIVAIIFVVSLSGSQSLTVFFAGIVFLVGCNLLWRPGEAPILLFVFVYQWLQASVLAFQVHFTGLSWRAMAEYAGDMEAATYLSLTGLLVLAFGLRWGAGQWRVGVAKASQNIALKSSAMRWFVLYLIALVTATVVKESASVIPALSQPLLALASLKWAFFFMFTYASFLRPSAERLLWILAFFIEFFLGFGGYFSDFKQVLFFTAMGILSAGIRLTPGRATMIMLLSIFTLVLAILWTAVKVDYRDFVSGGRSAQVTTVSYSESLSKFSELVGQLNKAKFQDATDAFLERLAYVNFFGATLDHVPRVVPHTRGELWQDAITRPFMPRALFPNKAIIDDSLRTIKYTGTWVAGADMGTSISIGYLGESYIDFGKVGMMIPILFWGYMLGRVYRWLVYRSVSRGLLGMGLSCAALYGTAFLEFSITKVFGGFAASLLVLLLLTRYVFPVYLPWCIYRPQLTAFQRVDDQVQQSTANEYQQPSV